MVAGMAMRSRSEHLFSWWHQGVMLYDRSYAWSDDFCEYTEAASGAWRGQSRSRAVTFVSLGGAVFSCEDAPLTVEVLDVLRHPRATLTAWASSTCWAASGQLVLEESGGGGGGTVLALPPGEWRARWSGFGEAAAEEREGTERPHDVRPDRYLLQLWPLRGPGQVVILRGY